MNPLVNVYGKVIVDSLGGLPDEMQRLVTSVRSCDMRITNCLSEYERGGLDENDFSRLAQQLKQAYANKRESSAKFVSALKDNLEILDKCQKEVLERVGGISDPVRREMVDMQEVTDIRSPYYGTSKAMLDPLISKLSLKLQKDREEREERSKLKRKPTPTDVVSGAGVEKVDPCPATMRLPEGRVGADGRTCVCGHGAHGDMVLCDNDLCPVGWFHFSCVGLSSKPQCEWYCGDCNKNNP